MTGPEDNAAPQKAKPDNRTLSQKRRADFQEQQREYLRGLGLMQQIQSDIETVTPENVHVVKFKTDARFKLLAKVLPDMKEIELTGPDGGPIETVSRIERVIVDGPAPRNT